MEEHLKNTIDLPGVVCEIIKRDGNQCQVRILCQPKYLLLECNSISDIHLGDKVIVNLKIETKNITPLVSNELSDNN